MTLRRVPRLLGPNRWVLQRDVETGRDRYGRFMADTEQLSVTVTGSVMAGGRSARMGQDKAALVLGDKPMGGWVRDALAAADVDSVVLAGGSASLGRDLDLDVVPDLVPGKGPLSALHALMTRFDAVVVVPCDVPLITTDVINSLIASWRTSGADVAFATREGAGEPLVSVWLSSTCLPVVQRHLDRNDLAVHGLFDQLTTCAVDSDPAKFVNVNTLAEFEELVSGL